MNSSKNNNRNWSKLVIITSVIAVGALIFSLLPKSFPTDTSIIGQGSNVLVLVFDPNLLTSIELTASMNEIRDEFADRVAFVITTKQTPDGDKFFNTYRIKPSALVFFNAQGENIRVIYKPLDAAALREALNNAFRY